MSTLKVDDVVQFAHLHPDDDPEPMQVTAVIQSEFGSTMVCYRNMVNGRVGVHNIKGLKKVDQ